MWLSEGGGAGGGEAWFLLMSPSFSCRHPAQGSGRVLRAWASLGAGCGIP